MFAILEAPTVAGGLPQSGQMAPVPELPEDIEEVQRRCR